MGFLIEFFNFRERLSGRRLKELVCYVVFGLLLTFLFSGKTSMTLETVVVSPDENYIACFERGNGYRIRCFRADGSLAFDYDVLSEVSAGGHCTLWFEDDILCAMFYRTDKAMYFSMDGTVLDITDNLTENRPPEFPSFSRKGYQYIFDGNKIDVVYDKGSFLGYWFLGSERYLAVAPQNGELRVLYAWTAAEGAVEKTD